MRLVIALEQRYQQAADGTIWTSSGFGNSFWERYLDSFDSVLVLARAQPVTTVDADSERVGSDRIQVAALPYYQGPMQFLATIRALRTQIREALDPDDAVIARLPGPIGGALIDIAGRDGRPWGAEVVGDPYDVFAPGAVRHPLRPVFRTMFTWILRRQARRAAALAYVSSGSLQARYLAGPGTFVTSYSSVVLHDPDFAKAARDVDDFVPPFQCTLVGSLEQMYKGVDVLLYALCTARRQGVEFYLTVVGEGRHRAELESLAASLGLTDSVQFAGYIADRRLISELLDRTDLFVLPSRTEGLPRAMIEAMARAVPCVGTSIGGIPELLEPDEMVQPGDAVSLARLLTDVLSDPDRLARLSAINLEKAQGFRYEILQERRKAFYSSLRKQTENWLHHGVPQ